MFPEGDAVYDIPAIPLGHKNINGGRDGLQSKLG